MTLEFLPYSHPLSQSSSNCWQECMLTSRGLYLSELCDWTPHFHLPCLSFLVFFSSAWFFDVALPFSLIFRCVLIFSADTINKSLEIVIWIIGYWYSYQNWYWDIFTTLIFTQRAITIYHRYMVYGHRQLILVYTNIINIYSIKVLLGITLPLTFITLTTNPIQGLSSTPSPNRYTYDPTATIIKVWVYCYINLVCFFYLKL